jgi:hypothetical protein
MIRSSDRSRIAGAAAVEAAGLLAGMHADDAADLLAEMSEERRAAVGEWLPGPQGRRIRVLLGKEPPSAAALMSRRLIALREDATVADALERVRNRGVDPESVSVVFGRPRAPRRAQPRAVGGTRRHGAAAGRLRPSGRPGGRPARPGAGRDQR